MNTFFLILSAEALSPKLIVQQGQGGENLTCFFIEAKQSLGRLDPQPLKFWSILGKSDAKGCIT